MNKYQKETENILLNHEQEAYDQLKKTYANALKEIKIHIRDLQQDIDILERANPDNKSLVRSKIYQLNYQKAMEEQLNSVIDMLKTSNTKTTQSFLTKMYEDSFLGINYDLQKQGIPVIMPINHKKIVDVINMPTEKLNFKDRTYNNVEELKKVVKAEISRGIAVGSSYNDIAKQVSLLTEVDYNKAKRIVRTEGGRVSSQAKLQSIQEAKKRGADVVKVWDATLDMKTRTYHLQLDGKWAEVDKPFKIGGMEPMAPHDFGRPEEDINCRCVLLSMPRWDLEDTYSKRDNITGELIECSGYEDWKNKYYDVVNSENYTKQQLKQFVFDPKTKTYYARNDTKGIEEPEELKKVVKEADERIADYKKEMQETSDNVDKALGRKLDDNQVYISSEENKALIDRYIDYYEKEDYLATHQKERYERLLKIKENGYKEEIFTLDSREKCEELLDRVNWMYGLNGDIANTDFELLREATQEIYRLTQKVPALLDDTTMNKYFLDARKTTYGIANTQMNTITLNNYYYYSYKALYESELGQLAQGWHTQVAPGNETKGIIVHEIGHLVQDRISWSAYAHGPKLGQYFEHLPKDEYDNYRLEDIAKELIEEPIRKVMAKENITRKEVIDKYVSQYGKSDYQEMFAETFANSQLGASNALGDALIEYLKELGQWK